MKKFQFVLLYIVILCVPITSHAMVFTEIYYDPEGTDATHEWVEVYNDGNESVDLSGWRFVENNVNHTLTVSTGDSVIEPGEYAVIADQAAVVLADFPSIPTLFDSAFSLNNTGELLALKDATLVIVDSVTYASADGGTGDGASLNKVVSSWVPRMPSPGFSANSSAPTPSDEEGDTTPNTDDDDNTDTADGDEETNTSNTSANSASKTDNNEKTKDPLYTLSLKTDDVASANNPVSFEGIMKRDQAKLISGRFVWSMGDGRVFETKRLRKFDYSYQHPGTYVVVLEYYKNAFDDEPFLRVTKKLSVLSGDIVIASINDTGSVELSNSDTKDIDIAGWRLVSGTDKFVFGANTFVLAGDTLHIPARIHKLAISSQSRIALYTPTAVLVASYPQSHTNGSSVSSSSDTTEDTVATDESRIIMNGQQATASNSLSLSGMWPWITGLVGLILVVVIGLVAVVRAADQKPVDNHKDDSGKKSQRFGFDDIELLN